MEKAYIILAHKNPQQLYKLIKKLDDTYSSFFVHIDKKIPFAGFEQISVLNNKVVFTKRVYTEWGGFGLVEATLNAMQAVKDSDKKYEKIILLSGQDYPIKSNKYINHYFSSSDYKVFIEYFLIPNYDKWQPRGGLFRIDKYFYGLKSHQRFFAKALNFLAEYFSFFNRKHPQHLKPYAGSQWWAIDNYALHYILDFIEKNPNYITFHKHTFAPDEVFFHTILLNAKDVKLKNSISNNHMRYMKWLNKYKGHPEVLVKDDIKNIFKSEALFARKFDMEKDADVLEMIDREHSDNIKSLVE